MIRKIGLVLAPLVAAGALALGGVAHAAPVASWTDTSVTAFPQSVDAITNVAAVTVPGNVSVVGSPTQVSVADKLQFGSSDGSATWSGTTITSGGLFSLPTLPVTSPVSFKVEATDGTAVAVATVDVGVGASAGTDTVTVVPDTVTLGGTNNNTTGQVDFFTTPPGVGLSLGNEPVGLSLVGNDLVAGDAIPGTYHNVTVTAQDAAGATAVDRLSAEVKGHLTFAVPTILYDGHGVATAPTREEVTYLQSGNAGWDYFQIHGFGAIDGHQGWVNGQLGPNTGYYSGLVYGHSYTACYVPVTGPGSITPVYGHGGCVYFIAGRH